MQIIPKSLAPAPISHPHSRLLFLAAKGDIAPWRSFQTPCSKRNPLSFHRMAAVSGFPISISSTSFPHAIHMRAFWHPPQPFSHFMCSMTEDRSAISLLSTVLFLFPLLPPLPLSSNTLNLFPVSSLSWTNPATPHCRFTYLVPTPSTIWPPTCLSKLTKFDDRLATSR